MSTNLVVKGEVGQSFLPYRNTIPGSAAYVEIAVLRMLTNLVVKGAVGQSFLPYRNTMPGSAAYVEIAVLRT